MSTDEDPPWYEDGLRFECTRCGRCCRGPGNVWVSDQEIESLAKCVGGSTEEFRAAYTKPAEMGGRVLAHKRNQDCVFWDETGGCRVYSSRPRQCLTYPFWRANLVNENAWRSERGSCPGVDRGPRHSRETIDTFRNDDGIPAHRTRTRDSKA